MFGEVPVTVVPAELDWRLVVTLLVYFCLGNTENIWFSCVDEVVQCFFIDDGPDSIDIPVSDDYLGSGGAVSEGPTVHATLLFQRYGIQQFLFEYFGPRFRNLLCLFLWHLPNLHNFLHRFF